MDKFFYNDSPAEIVYEEPFFREFIDHLTIESTSGVANEYEIHARNTFFQALNKNRPKHRQWAREKENKKRMKDILTSFVRGKVFICST